MSGDRLRGRVAFVTGGARGIGRAVAARFVSEGAAVTIADVDEPTGRTAAAALGEQCAFQHCDVAVETAVVAAVRNARDVYGPVDVLVNNAGVNSYDDAARMSAQDWDELMGIDFKGAWLCAKHVIPDMRERGRGSIVNIASIHAAVTVPGMFPYAAAKSGLVGLTRSLALECASDGIRVNALCPGFVRTHLVEEWLAKQPEPDVAERSILEAHPLGRIAEPDEIACFVAFLASDEASFVTGAALMADGGLSARMAV